MAIDKVLVQDTNAFVGLHDIAKLEVNTWKKQGVANYRSNKNKKLR